MKYERIIILIALAITLISFAKIASAAAVGISPATLSFSIPRGGEEIKTIQISTNSETPLTFSVSLDKSLNSTIEFEVMDKETAKGKPAEITVKAHSVRSAKPGNIDGTITVVVNTNTEEPSGSGSRIATAVVARINVEITNESVPIFQNKMFLVGTGLIAVLFIFGLTYLFRVARKSKKPKKTQKKRKRMKSRK
jgi:hypothetical protein